MLTILVAVVASLILDRRTAGTAVAVALGLFAALLTAITLVLILTLDVDSRWPTFNDVVEDSLLTGWFVLAMVAITLAAVGDDSAPTRLGTLALTLAIAGGVLGSLSLYHLLRISTGEGRERFLGSLLRTRIGGAPLPAIRDRDVAGDAAELSDFGSFFARLGRAIDSRDVTALRDRVFELTLAGEAELGDGIGSLIALDLRALRELGRAVLLARIDSPEVGSVLLPSLGSLIVDHTGQLLAAARQEEGPGGQERRGEAELRAAAYLGQAARLFAWIAGSAHSEALDKQATPALKAIAGGSAAARSMLVDAADPYAPEPLPSAHPWYAGIADPTAALVWWWCMCDLNGAHDGRAFYAVIAMLTGEKFFGSFGWGDRYLLGELETRLDRGREETRRQSDTDKSMDVEDIRTQANSAVRALGGVRCVALDLLTTSMACWRDRRVAIPEGMEQNWTYWEDPLRMARRARLFLPRASDPWVRDAEDGLSALARLISRGEESTSLAQMVKRCIGPLPTTTWPPLIDPPRRPGAAVLAVGLHLAPRYEHDSARELERFLGRLPSGLLEGALVLGEAILNMDEVGSGSSRSSDGTTQRIIQLLTFIQRDPQAERT